MRRDASSFSGQRGSEPEPPADVPAGVAIFPFATSESCARPVTARLRRTIEEFIRAEPSLVLAYSFYHGHRSKQRSDAADNWEAIWGGNYVRREPNVEQVYSQAQKVGADVVFMSWLECSPNDRIISDDGYPFDVYVFDLRNEQTYHHTDRLRRLEEGTEEVLAEFIADSSRR